MSEQIMITPEQMAEYQRQQQAIEQQATKQCINDLMALARERGYEIGAIPKLMPDGRIAADWGIQRKAT